MSCILAFVLAIAATCLSVEAQDVSLSPRAELPPGASEIVPKGFASFGIQASSFPYYFGMESVLVLSDGDRDVLNLF